MLKMQIAFSRFRLAEAKIIQLKNPVTPEHRRYKGMVFSTHKSDI